MKTFNLWQYLAYWTYSTNENLDNLLRGLLFARKTPFIKSYPDYIHRRETFIYFWLIYRILIHVCSLLFLMCVLVSDNTRPQWLQTRVDGWTSKPLDRFRSDWSFTDRDTIHDSLRYTNTLLPPSFTTSPQISSVTEYCSSQSLQHAFASS